MQVTIQSVADLGVAIRSVRRASKVRLDDLAAIASVSKQFASDVEHGKPTVQLGLVLRLLAGGCRRCDPPTRRSCLSPVPLQVGNAVPFPRFLWNPVSEEPI